LRVELVPLATLVELVDAERSFGIDPTSKRSRISRRIVQGEFSRTGLPKRILSRALHLLAEALGTGSSSWHSEDGGPNSRRGGETPSSCATPTSASFPSEPEVDVDVGVNPDGNNTTAPYPCQFCERTFPRLSYLKKHEQVRIRSTGFSIVQTYPRLVAAVIADDIRHMPHLDTVIFIYNAICKIEMQRFLSRVVSGYGQIKWQASIRA